MENEMKKSGVMTERTLPRGTLTNYRSLTETLSALDFTSELPTAEIFCSRHLCVRFSDGEGVAEEPALPTILLVQLKLSSLTRGVTFLHPL